MGICCSDPVVKREPIRKTAGPPGTHGAKPSKGGGAAAAKNHVKSAEVAKPAVKAVPALPQQTTEVVKKSRKKKHEELEMSIVTEIKATILIQKWYRVWVSKLQARREIAWSIFQKVEYYGERKQMLLNHFFRILIEEFQNEASESRKALSYDPPQSIYRRMSEVPEGMDDLVDIPASAGMDLAPPFNLEALSGLMNYLKRGSMLHAAVLSNLVIMTTRKLREKPNFNEVTTSVTKKLTIVGDLHGSLDDLFTIFYKNDIPSLSNPYVFNGDYVDRGRKSVEVMAVLCYCFLLYPNHVHLNRGNHEDPHLNEKYGFIKEVSSKYRQDCKRIYALFKELFRNLPVATIVDHRILVVHGGVSDITDLDLILEIPRENFISIIKPPRHVIEGQPDDWDQMMDIFWSDPITRDGCYDNELRGGGKCFGPNVTKEFLIKHNLELIVRSHECRPEGFQYDHDDKVITVFSSSNYYHTGSNRGAYIVYTGDIKAIRHIQYVCTDEGVNKITFKGNITSMEDKALQDLKRMICSNRSILSAKFKELDPDDSGRVTVDNYVHILKSVLGMNLPWRLIQPKISKRDEKNPHLVIYETSFLLSKELQEASSASSDVVFSHREILETIFHAIDRDRSGYITKQEFVEAMSVLHKHSKIKMDLTELEEMGDMMDFDQDGFIDINEFFEAFKLSRT